MIKYSQLISGKEYTLSELFDADVIISIPDLQRDYCWGVKNLGSYGKEQDEIVSSFFDSIEKESADKNNVMPTPTGLIYAYEWPKGTYQLCDGQQRITTLFLLAGILYRLGESDDIELKNILYRENGIKKGFASLQYGIRETSLHFLDDFTCNYFIERAPELHWRNKGERESEGVLESKDRPTWYFNEYDFDPTVQSMLCTTCILEEKLKDLSSEKRDEIKEYILHKMTFIFYDMESRAKGEETFVVINNTGEPLSSSENLKPKLLGLISDNVRRRHCVEQWEKREDFFWHNRNNETEFTSDDFSKDFYEWHFSLKLKKSVDKLDRKLLKSVEPSELDSIDKTFKAFTKFHKYCIGENATFITDDGTPIFEIIRDWDESSESVMFWLRQDDRRLLLLPILAYIKKFRLNDSFTAVDDMFFRKMLRNYISSSYKFETFIKSGELLSLIEEKSEAEDVVLQLPGNTILCDSAFNDDELLKLELDPAIRMNTDILFSESATPETVRNRYANLKYLCLLGDIEFAKEHVEDSNLYRVLRVFHDWGGKIEHQFNTTWDYYGRLINNLYVQSKKEYKLKYDTIYSSSVFKKLLDTPHERVSIAIRSMVKDYVSQNPQLLEVSSEQYSPSSFLKGWIYAKMLCVMDSGKLISFDKEPFGGFKPAYPQGNMINPNAPFTLVNCVARRFWKGGYGHVDKENYNIDKINSPLFSSDILDFEQWDTNQDNRFNIPNEFFEGVMANIRMRHNDFISK